MFQPLWNEVTLRAWTNSSLGRVSPKRAEPSLTGRSLCVPKPPHVLPPRSGAPSPSLMHRDSVRAVAP